MQYEKNHERFYFIEMCSYWQGSVNSSLFSNHFKLSVTQAKIIIGEYTKQHPDNIEYCKKTKGFKTTDLFNPAYISIDAYDFLNWLHLGKRSVTPPSHSHITNTSLNLPQRNISPLVMRQLVRAIEQKLRVDVEYSSLANPNGEGRIIHPHMFVKTGLRWHLRAFDEKHKAFRDFVLSRFTGEAELMDKASQNNKNDTAWHTMINVVIEPDQRLNLSQRQVVEREYNMQNGQLVIQTRAALVQYLLQEMQINLKMTENNPTAQQIILVNKADIKQWLFPD
jgi:hypothetical protein